MNQTQLTEKQRRYLALIQQAESEGKSLKAAAVEQGIDPKLVYAARQSLQRKGALPKPGASKFAKVASAPIGNERVEIRTQLTNGQPVWLSVAAEQLSDVLRALSA